MRWSFTLRNRNFFFSHSRDLRKLRLAGGLQAGLSTSNLFPSFCSFCYFRGFLPTESFLLVTLVIGLAVNFFSFKTSSVVIDLCTETSAHFSLRNILITGSLLTYPNNQASARSQVGEGRTFTNPPTTLNLHPQRIEIESPSTYQQHSNNSEENDKKDSQTWMAGPPTCRFVQPRPETVSLKCPSHAAKSEEQHRLCDKNKKEHTK